MTDRIVLMGEAPGKNTDPDAPLFPYPLTSTGGRLFDLTGLELRSEYLKRFQRCNLLRYYPGENWPKEAAATIALSMRQLLLGRTVLLIGRNVAEAFDMKGFEPLEWREDRVFGRYASMNRVDPAQMALVPHPSGLNRFYNSEENSRRVRNFFADLLSE